MLPMIRLIKTTEELMTNDEQTNEPAAEDLGNPAATRPIASFQGSGGLQVAVWKNKSESGIENYSVRIERSYKVDDKFRSSGYLRDSDLLRAEKLLSQADNWIEQDKQKHRGSSAGRG